MLILVNFSVQFILIILQELIIYSSVKKKKQESDVHVQNYFDSTTQYNINKKLLRLFQLFQPSTERYVILQLLLQSNMQYINYT